MTSKFDPEILKLIEKGDYKEAQKIASKEILVLWIQQEREKLKITNEWLKNVRESEKEFKKHEQQSKGNNCP